MVNKADKSIIWRVGVDINAPWGPINVSSKLKLDSAFVGTSTAWKAAGNYGDLSIMFQGEFMVDVGDVGRKDLGQTEED